MTPGEAQALLHQARTAPSDLERKLAASVLLAARVFPISTTTTSTSEPASPAAGSSTMQFKKATKTQAKLRLTFDGPAGSGKTYSSLLLAKHLGGRTALIDTEHGSAAKYANLFDFETLELEEFSLDTYLKAIEAAKAQGFEVLIIDSLSHAWTGKGGALEEVDRTTGASKFTGGWRQVTPKHNRLVDAMLAFPGHVICTMRSKMAYVLVKDQKGKEVPQKVGLAPVQREGMEYEFDVVADLSVEGDVSVSKTRCPDIAGSAGLLRHADIPKLGETLKAWLTDGTAPVPAPAVTPPQPPPPPVNFTPAPLPSPAPSATRSAQPTAVEQVEIGIAEAQTRDDLDGLLPRINRLSFKEKAMVRSKWTRRRRELQLLASRAGSGVANADAIGK